MASWCVLEDTPVYVPDDPVSQLFSLIWEMLWNFENTIGMLCYPMVAVYFTYPAKVCILKGWHAEGLYAAHRSFQTSGASTDLRALNSYGRISGLTATATKYATAFNSATLPG